MNGKPTRRELLRPLHLLGIAFGSALFAGFVTGFSMGGFQGYAGAELWQVWSVALIVAGIVFIAVLLGLSILLLAVDPAEIAKPMDRPVLLPEDETSAGDDDGGSTPSTDSGTDTRGP